MVKSYQIKFFIDNKIFLTFKSVEDFTHLNYCDQVEIWLNTQSHHYLLYNDSIGISLESLQVLLEKELNNKLRFSGQNLGYLWNENLQSDFELEEEDWFGLQYLLWSAKGITTWIYQKDNKIYLEISPTYKWHFSDPSSNDKDYISFENFLKNYDPHYIIEIGKNTAIEWLVETNSLLATLKNNESKYE